MDMEEKDAGTTRNRRSSILKRKSRTKSDEDDLTTLIPSNEVLQSTKSTRRVSFASSNFVKPFVADPDKNTIWDTTYEEAVNHTDSTKSSQERSERTDLNVTTINSEFLLVDNTDTDIATINIDENGKLHVRAENTIFDNNPMEFTRINRTVTSVSEMEITTNASLHTALNAIDKENLHPDVIAAKENMQRHVLYARESILNYAKNKIQENGDDKENIPIGFPIALQTNKDDDMADDVSCVSMDIETEGVQFATATGGYQKWDDLQESRTMEFTCQLPNRTNVVEDFDKSTTDMLEDDMEFTCHNPQIMQARQMNITEKLEQNMELTGQIPQWQRHQPSTMPDLSTMEFTCQASQKQIQQILSTTRNVEQTMNLTCLLPRVETRRDLDASGMELTCQIPQARFLNKTKTLIEQNMELTCQIEKERDLDATRYLEQDMELTRRISQVHKAPEELNKTKIAELNMEFTCQIPPIQKASKELNKTKIAELNMEFTCQIPPIQKASKELNKTKVAEQNMELTCQIPQTLSGNRTKTLTEQNMELTCRIQRDREMSDTKNLEQDMELTRQIPQIREAAKELNSTKVAPQNMELTCRIPQTSKLINRTNVVDQNMEFTCQIQRDREMSDTKNLEQDMELTRQIPQIREAAKELNSTKVAPQNMELTCQIPQTSKLFNRTNVVDLNMEFTCLVPGTEPIRDNVDLEQSMELTCHVPQKQTLRNMNTTKKLEENMEFTCHQISQAPNPGSSRMVQENLEFIRQNPHIKVQQNLEKSQMELTCQVPQTRIQQINQTKSDGVRQEDMESTCKYLPTVQPSKSHMDSTCQVSQTKTKSDQTVEQNPRLATYRENIAYCRNKTIIVETDMPNMESTCNDLRNKSDPNPDVVEQKSTTHGSSRKNSVYLETRRNRDETSNAFKQDYSSTGNVTTNTLAEVASTIKVGHDEDAIRSGIARLEEKSSDKVNNTRLQSSNLSGSTDPVAGTAKVFSPPCENSTTKKSAVSIAGDDRLVDADDQTKCCDILRGDLHKIDSPSKTLELTKDQTMAVNAETLLSNTVAMDMAEVEVNAAARNVPEPIPNMDAGSRADGNSKISESVSDITTTKNLLVDIEVPKTPSFPSNTTSDDTHLLGLPEDKPPKTIVPMDSMVTTTNRTFTNTNDKDLMKTPEPSFHINLTGLSSCTDDTQQLIHYTFTKQLGSCNMLPSFKENDNTIGDNKNRLLISLSQTDDINVTAPNLDDNNTTTANNIDLENMSVRLPKNRLTAVNDTYVLNKRNLNCDVATSSHQPETDSSNLIFSNDSIIELVPAHDDSVNSSRSSTSSTINNDDGVPTGGSTSAALPIIIDHGDSDPEYGYPLTRKALKNLQSLKPLKLRKFDHASTNLLLQEVNRQREEIAEYLKSFKFKCYEVPDSIPCVMDEQSSECEAQVTPKKNHQEQQHQQNEYQSEQAIEPIELSSTSSTDDNSIIKRIEEAQERCDDDWKLDKYEYDRCHFSTLCGTLIFIVDIEMISGIVSSIETKEELEGVSDPLAYHLNHYLARKLTQECLCSALGPQYDVFSLLDYIQMNVIKIQRFCKVSKELIKHGVVWERDHMMFEVNNYNLIVLLRITVDMNKLESPEEDDVQVDILIGKLRDSYITDIKKLAESCPKGLDFFMSYLRKIEEYLVQKEKYLRSKKV